VLRITLRDAPAWLTLFTMSSLRERISAVTQELYLERGIEGVSMRKVAERVGVSAPAIYRHFKNKDELLSEIVVQGLRILEEYLRPALEQPKASERLRRMIDGYLEFALAEPKYFDFAFLTPSHDINRLADELAKPHAATFRIAIDVVADCMREGTFAPGDPLEAGILLWAEAHGLVTLFRTGRFGEDQEMFRQIYRRLTDRVLDGLRPVAPLA
jgi:AcrR family transcriptional regulator